MFGSFRVTAIIVGALLLLGPSGLTATDDRGTRMLHEPAMSDSHIAFAYDRDLWIADRDGSHARRLTSHEGIESSPRFSPDGEMIAFSAQYDGNLDVYIMPITGGAPKRLTYHPSPDYVEGFTPDGDRVVFSSTRNTFTSRYRKLLSVSTEGGFPETLPIPNGLRASFSPDGSLIAYIPIAERFFQWKNYRGGTCSRIWIQSRDDASVQQVPQPEGRCNDTDPVFVGNTLYFRSDRNGEFNIFSFDLESEAVTQLPHFEDFHVNRITESRDALIFEQAGYLHHFDPSSNESTAFVVHAMTDMTETRERFVSGSNWVRNADISPTGSRAVFEYRGEIITVPASHGDPRNLTQTSGAHERSPAWSPDGRHVAYFSDASGEYQLHIASQNGSAETQVIDIMGNGFYSEPEWSPDSEKICYIDNSKSLFVVDISSGECQRIDGETHYGPGRFPGLAHRWSPDSKWIVYTVNTHAMIQQVFVYDVDEATSYPITDGMSEVSEPVFDQSGDYLYFIASTNAGPVKHWFAMSNADMELTNSIYVAVLRDDGAHPLPPRSDEEATEGSDSSSSDDASEEQPTELSVSDGEGEDASSDTSEDSDEDRVVIDFDGLDQRIVALPVGTAVFSNLRSGKDGVIFYLKQDDGGDILLERFSLEKRSASTVMQGARTFELSEDGNKLLYSTGASWGTGSSAGTISLGSGSISIGSVEVRIDPREEWQQVFDEVWRINRDYFYDPGMHGADWPAMREKYAQFLPHCITRGDLNRVLVWMCSEIAVGHHRVGGGDVRPDTDNVPGGLLGADFEIADNRYRFAKVFGGLNWNGTMRAPLTEPGVRIREGEYLISIQGRELTGDDNVHQHLENTSGKTIRMRVGPNADGSDSREVDVTPITSESALRNRDWVEGNLRRVTEATDGRVAYVYVPNTSTNGHRYFKRYFFPQTDRDAIIIDERFNGGGQVADYYIDHLRRPYISHWATRYGEDFMSPTGAIHGPKIMLIDETAGSGGDLLPWMFRKLELGTLVGRPTWGGLVGTLGFPVLMDGGFVSAPNLAIWTEDGFIVENVGVPPDVEVEQWPAEVLAGRDPQLERAIELILEQLEENPPREYVKPPFPIRVR